MTKVIFMGGPFDGYTHLTNEPDGLQPLTAIPYSAGILRQLAGEENCVIPANREALYSREKQEDDTVVYRCVGHQLILLQSQERIDDCQI